MSNLQIFKYNGSSITFATGNGTMVNATEMAKPFGKQPYDWVKTQSANEFIDAVSVTKNIGTENLIQVKQGGACQGTWFHEDVALEFARWLSPLFAIWCNDRIKEILKNGVCNIDTIKSMSADDAILYGYGKALEKINRQSTIIRRQSKQLQEFKRRSEEEKARKAAKLLENKTEELSRIAEWIDSENDFSRCEDVVSLNDLLRMCSTFFLTNGYDDVKRKSVSKVLSEQGYKKIRKAKGIYFVLR